MGSELLNQKNQCIQSENDNARKPLWRPEHTFEVCHELYEHFKMVLENRFSTIRVDGQAKYLWHPDRPPKVSEYVADFALVGRCYPCRTSSETESTVNPRAELRE